MFSNYTTKYYLDLSHEMSASHDAGATVSHTADPGAPFVPSPVDILVVRAMLRKARSLPYEIANRIIEFAEYWTCSHTSISYRNPDTGAERSFGQDSNKFLVSCHLYPLFTLVAKTWC